MAPNDPNTPKSPMSDPAQTDSNMNLASGDAPEQSIGDQQQTGTDPQNFVGDGQQQAQTDIVPQSGDLVAGGSTQMT